MLGTLVASVTDPCCSKCQEVAMLDAEAFSARIGVGFIHLRPGRVGLSKLLNGSFGFKRQRISRKLNAKCIKMV